MMEAEQNLNKEDGVWKLTPWGCMYAILEEYGFDPGRLTPTMGVHMVEDFMDLLIQAGIAEKAERESE